MNAVIQYNDDKEKSNEQTTNERTFTLICDNCDTEFDPWDVTRSIINKDTALYTCLSCATTIRGPKPYLRYRTDDSTTDE